MSSDPHFSIIGDANVRRNMTGLNIASRDVMKSAQVIDCIHPSTFNTALQEVKPEASVLIMATMTEFIISNGFSGTVLSSIDPILASFITQICGYCAFRPTLQVRRMSHISNRLFSRQRRVLSKKVLISYSFPMFYIIFGIVDSKF